MVAILAELGQKGGLLKLVGKLALLWGGMRGAMSLTDRLISFLRIAEQPLLQRFAFFYSVNSIDLDNMAFTMLKCKLLYLVCSLS